MEKTIIDLYNNLDKYIKDKLYFLIAIDNIIDVANESDYLIDKDDVYDIAYASYQAWLKDSDNACIGRIAYFLANGFYNNNIDIDVIKKINNYDILTDFYSDNYYSLEKGIE